MVFSEDGLQVKSVNSGVIEKLEHLGNLQENGWFFTSKSGNKIDGRYIFATESSASKNDLIKVLGDGEIKTAIKITAHKFSKSAKAQIEKSGGEAIIV